MTSDRVGGVDLVMGVGEVGRGRCRRCRWKGSAVAFLLQVVQNRDDCPGLESSILQAGPQGVLITTLQNLVLSMFLKRKRERREKFTFVYVCRE